MLTKEALVLTMIGAAAIFLSEIKPGMSGRSLSAKQHRVYLCIILLLGCFVRLWKLDSLPSGISAEEALVGVQAKALWQTGGFLFGGNLTTQFTQWTGETCGPLLATLTAPFVGLGGLTPLMTRLPLALVSCLAVVFAYGLGMRLGGERMGRWCLTVYALCPYFVLAARMTSGINLGVSLFPIALCVLTAGMKSVGCLYAGMALTALLSYTQDMYFFIAPAMILLAAALAGCAGIKKRHALLSGAMGILLCVPAILTLIVNLFGEEGFTMLGMLDIPQLEAYEKADSFVDMIEPGTNVFLLAARKVWAILTGGIFQIVLHVYMNTGMYTPDGMLALYFVSLPLIALGVLWLATCALKGMLPEKNGRTAWVLTAGTLVIVLAALLFYGSEGVMIPTGCTSVWDYSTLFLFAALLMCAGLCRIERKSFAGTAVMCGVIAVNFALLCVYLFGGAYQKEANTYLDGFGEMAIRAHALREKTGKEVVVTHSVWPHIQQDQAAEMMYLYASDMDLHTARPGGGAEYTIVHIADMDQPDPSKIYLVRNWDTVDWNTEGYACEESGEFTLLYQK